MRFESYAQELEDIILYIALQDVKRGFYIDIGANDPVDISVTKLFYDRGWNGINIEPLRKQCLLLENKRQRDINLCIGISDRRGILPLFGKGTGATFSKNVALKNNFMSEQNESKIMMTLSDIYEQYCTLNQQIHFCKIDVEGYEKEVLGGVTNWEKYRPWIFVIESKEPGTDIPSYDKWENILFTNNYILGYETAINRFYVDKRHEYILERFKQVDEFFHTNEIVRMKMENIWKKKSAIHYLSPYLNLLQEKRIVLYGAGLVGKSYYALYERSKDTKIVLWVDQRCEKYGGGISPVKCIFETEYDYILIAVMEKSTAEEIRKKLVNQGVKNSNILWSEPISLDN